MSNKNIEKVVKITKRERFAELLAIPEVANNQDLVDFINHEVDLLTRKNASGEKKLTANQLENENLKAIIVNSLSTETGMTITEMIKTIPELAEFTNQKVSALTTALVKDGKVERRVEKRVTKFYKVV